MVNCLSDPNFCAKEVCTGNTKHKTIKLFRVYSTSTHLSKHYKVLNNVNESTIISKFYELKNED